MRLRLGGRAQFSGDRLDVLLGARGLLAALADDEEEACLGGVQGLLIASGIAEGAKAAVATSSAFSVS